MTPNHSGGIFSESLLAEFMRVSINHIDALQLDTSASTVATSLYPLHIGNVCFKINLAQKLALFHKSMISNDRSAVCKSVYSGSNPDSASKKSPQKCGFFRWYLSFSRESHVPWRPAASPKSSADLARAGHHG